MNERQKGNNELPAERDMLLKMLQGSALKERKKQCEILRCF